MSGIFWLASYPKSGNTWVRAFLKNLQEDLDQPVDINQLRFGEIASDRGWMDDVLGFDTADLTEEETERLRPVVYAWSRHNENIRYHKIHDAYTVLPNGEPIVSKEASLGALYILRNPLDVAISFSHHLNCSIDDAINKMGNEKFCFSSKDRRLNQQLRQRLLSWSGHVESWADAEDINKEVIRFEDMKAEPFETFTRIAAFLQFPTEKPRIEKAIRFSDILELQRQESQNGFIERPMHTERFFRKGVIGDWRATLTSEQVKKIITDHFTIMHRFGYVDEYGKPMEE